MQIIYSSISLFIISFLIGNGTPQVLNLSEENINLSGSVTNNGFNQFKGPVREHNSYHEKPAHDHPVYLSPEIAIPSHNSTFGGVGSGLEESKFPQEAKKTQVLATEVPTAEENASQIGQPDFSSELMNEVKPTFEVATEQQLEHQNGRTYESTRTPMEESTLQDIEEELLSNFGSRIHASNDLNTDGDVYNEDNENDDDSETQLMEPLPIPVALISSNGEGSNPPLEEEFAEAFKRVGPNGRRRRVRPGGRRRVRMRVRKMNRENSTQSSTEIETPNPTPLNNEVDGSNGFETTTVKPRRYRSTTAAPGQSPPEILASGLGSSSVVKNGPKPLIITDIHSGSTGINPVTPEPQLEKPIIGGYTEKISTYFVSPPAKISTTEPPKLPSNSSDGDLDSHGIDVSKLAHGIALSNTGLFDSQREAWGNGLTNSQVNSFYSTSTERNDPVKFSTTTPNSVAPTNAEIMENIENSLHQPPMQDRTYTVQDHQGVTDQNGLESFNSFGSTPATLGMESSIAPFINPFGFNGGSGNQPGSNEAGPQTFSQLGRYEENAPFGTEGSSTAGSHYNRNKDIFLNGNQPYFKETSPYLSNGPDGSVRAQPQPESQNNQNNNLQFQQNEFSSTPPTGEEYFNHQNQNNDNFGNQIIHGQGNEFYNEDGFKSSPQDPMLGGVVKNDEPYPPFRRVPTLHNNGNGFENQGPSAPSGVSLDGHHGPTAPEGFSQNVHNNYPPSREGYPDNNPNSFNSPSGFEHLSGTGGPDQGQFSQTTGSSTPSINIPGYSQSNPEISNDPSAFSQTTSQGDVHPNGPSGVPVFGTVESVPVYDANGGPNHIQSDNQNNVSPRYPAFAPHSPGNQNRGPQFFPGRPQGPPPPYHRGPTFFRNKFRPQGPPMNSLPRYFPRPVNGQEFRGEPTAHSSNFRGNQGPPVGLHPGFHGPQQHGRPPPDFQNVSPHVNLPMPGLQNIPHPPNEQQALSEVSPIHHFPPHAHSMSSKPDYEPANPPLPHGHPLENHFESFTGNNNAGDGNHLKNFQDSNNGGQVGSSSGDTQLTAPSQTANDDPSHNNNGPDFDILSAYYDKPPPTVGYEYNNQYQMKEPSAPEVNDNELLNVPYQYSNTDGGGLDGGVSFHNFETNNEDKEKPDAHLPESKPEIFEDPEQKSPQNENKNKSSVYSNTPYVLMFPQLVPQEAMIPAPPKMLTKEIPVVSASSMSAMRFTPEGKPVLGPGLKAVAVHPRNQMYQVLAKAHYEKAMKKYLESKKKPPSAIYTPYGVLVPMGPSGAASSTHETYTAMNSNMQQHDKDPQDKQLLNLLLGKKNPLGHFHINKGTSLRNGRIKNHFDFKASVDPALDLLAEKLAIKLDAVKYVLSQPAKLGINAFAKHATSYSQHSPVSVPNPKDKGETGQFGLPTSFGIRNKGKLNLNSKPGGRSLPDSNHDLKLHLKRLLKERLKEVLDEVEAESREHQAPSARTVHQIIPMASMMMESKLPPPPPNSNLFTNYFTPSDNPSGNGLIGTIKRLFSFGGDNSRSEGVENGRSEYPSVGSNLLSRNASTHPFSWYGIKALTSIGRMGALAENPGSSSDTMKISNKQVSEKKPTKQLDKWLDLVLKSANEPSLSSFNNDEHTKKTKQMLYNYDNPLASSSSSSILRVLPPTKISPTTSSKISESLFKRLGEPSGRQSASSKNTWKPVLNAFTNVFNNYSPGKNPTILRQRVM